MKLRTDSTALAHITFSPHKLNYRVQFCTTFTIIAYCYNNLSLLVNTALGPLHSNVNWAILLFATAISYTLKTLMKQRTDSTALAHITFSPHKQSYRVQFCTTFTIIAYCYNNLSLLVNTALGSLHSNVNWAIQLFCYGHKLHSLRH